MADQPAWRSLTSCVGEGLAADGPLAAGDLFDGDPGDGAHVLALDVDHGLGEAGQHLLLLVVVEHTLDELHVEVRHGGLPGSVRVRRFRTSTDCARGLVNPLGTAGPAPCKDSGQTADVDFRVLGSVGIVDGTALAAPRGRDAASAARAPARLPEFGGVDRPAGRGAVGGAPRLRRRNPAELRVAAAALRRARRRGRGAGEPGARLRAGAAGRVGRRRPLRSRRWPRARPCWPGIRSPPSTCLDAALGEWRGDAFAEFAETEWIRPEAVRLEELRLVATEARDRRRAPGRPSPGGGRPTSRRCSSTTRCASSSPRQSMLALYRSGRQAEALRIAQQFRAALRDDLGLEPSADAARPGGRDPRGARRASRGCRRRRRPRRAATARAAGHRDALPMETTALVGRERDLELAGRLLESGRILTLFGPGGVGKTRLAHRLASTLADAVRRRRAPGRARAGAATRAR